MFELTKKEEKVFQRLNSPAKIQDFLNQLPMNFEPHGDTLKSPRFVLKERNAHCLEGAFFAAAVLWYHGQQPLLLDLQAAKHDFDHVVALFKKNNRWGAISKTNHAVLRYREPVYRSPDELAMSYFHEYFTNDGRKTMRAYSRPFNLKKYGTGWVISEKDLWDMGDDLDASSHVKIATPALRRMFRKPDLIEIKVGKIVEWKK